MYTDPWEQFQSEPSTVEAWHGSLDDGTTEDKAWLHAQRAAEEAEATANVEPRDRRTAIAGKDRAEDSKTEAEKKSRKKETVEEESDVLFKPLSRISVEKTYFRRGEEEGDVDTADVSGSVRFKHSALPQQYDQTTSRSNTSTASVLGGPHSQSTQSSSQSSISYPSLPLSPFFQQPKGSFGPLDTEATYHDPEEQDEALDELIATNAYVGDGISFSQHVSLPLEDGVQPFETANTPFGNTIWSWQSSPYSYVQSGQIGSLQDRTGRRTNETIISQNVGSVSDRLRRNPNRKENTEMAATMAFTSPIVDMPYSAHETSPPASTSLGKHKTHSKKDQAQKSKKSDSGTSMTTNAKKGDPAPTTPETKAPQLTRNQEHQSHISELTSLETSGKYWSNTGQQYDVESSDLASSIRTSLQQVSHLGSGNFARVHRVALRSIPLARKTFQFYSTDELLEIKKEVDHAKTLSGHEHIIRLVGTYLDRHSSHSTFYILTYPVADCDMAAFLADFEASVFTVCPTETVTKLCYASGIAATSNRYTPLSALLRKFLKSTLGCITTAIQFMHRTKISHDDIKPANILLRSGTIFITDFGISRNRLASTQTSTELYVGHTHGWTAPEKADQGRHDPLQADVYSLGCVFMHIISLLSGTKTRKDCSEALASPSWDRERYIKEHFADLHKAAFVDSTPQDGWVRIMDLAKEMLSNERHARPKIEGVNQRLAELGGAMKSFHGGCCRRDVGPEGAIRLVLQRMQPSPLEANARVKTTSEIDSLTIRPPQRQTDAGMMKVEVTRQMALENDQTIRPATLVLEAPRHQASGSDADRDTTLKPARS